MLNQIVIVGRMTSNPELKEEEGRNKLILTLAVPRAYKNEDGIYDTDFIDCVVWDGIATNTNEYCKKGDIVGVKGRVQSRVDDDGNKVMEIIAEKVTFLSSKKENE